MGYPSVYPTGVTVYDPEQAWSGYTIFQAPGVGALLIDMSGREVQPTLEIKWQYTPKEAGFVVPLDAARFYSPFISSAQRLPNTGRCRARTRSGGSGRRCRRCRRRAVRHAGRRSAPAATQRRRLSAADGRATRPRAC